MPRLAPTVASLALLVGVPGLGAGGCGVVDEARERVAALLDGEPPPAPAPEVVAPADDARTAAAVSETGAGGTSGDTGTSDATGPEVATRGDGADPARGSTAADGDAGTSDETGTLPMSYARPPTVAGPAVVPGPEPVVVPPTPPTPPVGPEVPPTTPTSPTTAFGCLEGEWEAQALHAWFRREVGRQAHGRTVRLRGESGSYRLRLSAGVLHGEAEHRRISFDARLANVDIRYGIDVHGAFEADARLEGTDVLVVDRPSRNTLRVREVVRFSADKSEARALELPVEGRWQTVCGPASLELRWLEDGKPGPVLRFVRPTP